MSLEIFGCPMVAKIPMTAYLRKSSSITPNRLGFIVCVVGDAFDEYVEQGRRIRTTHAARSDTGSRVCLNLPLGPFRVSVELPSHISSVTDPVMRLTWIIVENVEAAHQQRYINNSLFVDIY